MWTKHAQACAGYHEAHSKLGIPEPITLDPLCGAAAIAASLRSLNLPWDKQTVLKSCRVTGLGSSLRDLANAGPGLHVNIRPLTATDEGLKALPKPLIAYVERDHFISVVKADAHGVSYLCSDCGPWPGGLVNLTWMQWHTMNPGIYASITKPGTMMDRALAAQEYSDQHAGAKQVAASGTQVASIDLNAKIIPYLPALPILKGVQFRFLPTDDITCGYSGYFGGDCPPCQQPCPMDSQGTSGSSGGTGGNPGGGDGTGGGIGTGGAPVEWDPHGPSAGDPVNLATGGEEYTPASDLVVYNPQGPSVNWQRLYNSLRTIEERDSAHQASWSYEYSDYGYAWSQQYNISVVIGSSTDYLILPNGSRIAFTAASTPTSSNPNVNCTVQAGSAVLIQWKYNTSTSNTYFTVTWPDRAVWTTTNSTSSDYGGGDWQLAQITDRNGNSIYFNYGTTQVNGYYLLNSITSQPAGAGTQLLTIVRNTVGAIISVTDCYGRSVYYHVIAGGEPEKPTLDFVSQIVPSCSGSVPVRYQYGYVYIYNSEGYHSAPFLHTISVPSPTGTGMSTATINYASTGAPYVTSLVDANGNTRTYTAIDQLDTQVTVTNPSGQTVYSYIGTFDNNMSSVAKTDGSGQLFSQNVYSDPNDPYRPSVTLDAIAARAAISANSIYAGYSGTIAKSGSDLPTTGTWQVLNPSGTVVGSSSTTNGWAVSYSSGTTDFTITVPASTTSATGYEVKYASVGSADFNVLSASMTGWGITQYTWDQYGNELTETSPRGVTTTNSYSYSNFALGELTQTQVGTKSPTNYSYYEPSGLVSSAQMPLPGTVGSSSYATYSYTYNSYGDVTQITTPGNNAVSSITTTYYYGSSPAVREPLTETDTLGYTNQYTYDTQGNLTSITDGNGNETYYGDDTGHNGYNIANQLLLITYPATGQTGTGNDQTVSTYLYTGGPQLSEKNYDESGNQIKEVDTTYGQEGEVSTISGGTEPVSYTYDAQYRVLSTADGNNNITAYSYNIAGYPERINYPGSGGATSGNDTTQYTSYDADGDLTQRIDGNGVTTDYAYSDPERELTTVTYPASTSIDVGYTYDSYSRKATMSDGTGSTGYTYDDVDEPTAISTTYTGLPTQTMSYAYYADGSTETMTTPAGSFSYDYDGDGRTTSLTNPNGETSNWTYQNNDWLKTQVLSNGVTATYTYNARGFLNDLTNSTSGGTTLSEFGSMAYSGVGDRTALTISVPSQPTFSGTTTYGYDTISSGGTRDQLTGESSTRLGGYSQTNAYDNAGNPTTLRSASAGTYNSDNQTTTSGFAYDGNGNPTTYNGTTLAFDPENRMSAFGSVLTAGYNGDDLRAWKTTSAGTTYYLYDGEQPVCELNSSGTVTAVNTFGIEGLLSRYSSASSVFYTFDPQGNPSQRLDSSGNILTTSAFDAFGNRTITSSTTDPFSGYGAEWGYYTDSETGLELCTYRFYDPVAERFINRDPSGSNGGINLYTYTVNDPIALSDSLGLSPQMPEPKPGDPNRHRTMKNGKSGWNRHSGKGHCRGNQNKGTDGYDNNHPKHPTQIPNPAKNPKPPYKFTPTPLPAPVPMPTPDPTPAPMPIPEPEPTIPFDMFPEFVPL